MTETVEITSITNWCIIYFEYKDDYLVLQLEVSQFSVFLNACADCENMSHVIFVRRRIFNVIPEEILKVFEAELKRGRVHTRRVRAVFVHNYAWSIAKTIFHEYSVSETVVQTSQKACIPSRTLMYAERVFRRLIRVKISEI